MDAFAATVEALSAAPVRARAQLTADWLASLQAPARRAAQALLSRTEVSVPADLIARLPGIEPAARSLSMQQAVGELDALAAERSPARKLERLTSTLQRLTAEAARCYLALATGTLRLDEQPSRPPLGTLVGVLTEATGRRGTLAVRGREGFVEVGRADLPDDEGLEPLLERLVIERDGSRRWLRPEVVVAVPFEGVRRDARWSSGFALMAPKTGRWLADRQPFTVDTIERVEAFHQQSRTLVGARPSTPPPLKSRRLDDLPLFGGPQKTAEE